MKKGIIIGIVSVLFFAAGLFANERPLPDFYEWPFVSYGGWDFNKDGKIDVMVIQWEKDHSSRILAFFTDKGFDGVNILPGSKSSYNELLFLKHWCRRNPDLLIWIEKKEKAVFARFYASQNGQLEETEKRQKIENEQKIFEPESNFGQKFIRLIKNFGVDESTAIDLINQIR